MDVDYKNYTLLRKSILIKLKPKTEVEKTVIYMKETIDDSQIQFFEVIKTAPEVTLVKEGDVVAISWLNCTSQFNAMYEGQRLKMGISDESKIEFILED